MDKNIQMVYTYHNETKHAQHRYARSLGYMDWATQPDPYRTYEDAKQIKLPLTFDNKTLSYKDIFDENDASEFSIDTISQFFQFSLGLAAVKSYGGNSWALRCNASSGNLQPSESYILCKDIENIDDGLYHYGVKDHHLELLAKSTKEIEIPKDSFIIGLSSIVWREAWKYGERAWRYTQLDCGHALKALEISAKILGWQIKVINANNQEIDSLLGLDDKSRFVESESEHSDLLFLVSKANNSDEIDLKKLNKSLEKPYNSKANQLSMDWHYWDILEEIEQSARTIHSDQKIFTSKQTKLRACDKESKEVVLKRRSVQMMDKMDALISKKEFETILSSVSIDNPAINLVIFIHQVEELPSGLYILLGDKKEKEKIQSTLKDSFVWHQVSGELENLYLLQGGDFRNTAKIISCSQDIASESSFSLGMLCEFDEQIKKYGSHRYKELYWNCGAMGQQLYLEATSLNLSATGIGCFLDDLLHDLIGIKNTSYQSLYHFTIGRGLVDTRLTNTEPYEHRKE